MLKFTMNALLSVTAAMYTAVSLYACQPAPQVSVDVPAYDIPIEPEATIVNILQSRPADSLPLQQAIDLYATANSNVHINVKTVSGDSDYHVALRLQLLSGERCDVFQVFSGQEAREIAPYLADISDLEWIRNAAEQSAEPLMWNNSIYGLPYSLECYGLLLNRNIFETSGISISSLKSFADLESAMEAIRTEAREATLTDVFPKLRNITDFPIQDKRYLTDIVANVLLTSEFESTNDVLNAKEIKLPYGAEHEELFRMMMRYSPRGDWAERDGLSYGYQLEAFANQEIALLLCSSADVDNILRINPALAGRLALIPVMLPDVDESKIYTGVPMWWAIGAHSTVPVQENAKRFLTWLYCSETGSVAIAARMGITSPWFDTAKETGNPVSRQMLTLIEKGYAEPQMWREYPYDWNADVFVPSFRSYFAGEQKWAEMLAEIREEWAMERYAADIIG